MRVSRMSVSALALLVAVASVGAAVQRDQSHEGQPTDSVLSRQRRFVRLGRVQSMMLDFARTMGRGIHNVMSLGTRFTNQMVRNVQGGRSRPRPLPPRPSSSFSSSDSGSGGFRPPTFSQQKFRPISNPSFPSSSFSSKPIRPISSSKPISSRPIQSFKPLKGGITSTQSGFNNNDPFKNKLPTTTFNTFNNNKFVPNSPPSNIFRPVHTTTNNNFNNNNNIVHNNNNRFPSTSTSSFGNRPNIVGHVGNANNVNSGGGTVTVGNVVISEASLGSHGSEVHSEGGTGVIEEPLADVSNLKASDFDEPLYYSDLTELKDRVKEILKAKKKETQRVEAERALRTGTSLNNSGSFGFRQRKRRRRNQVFRPQRFTSRRATTSFQG